MVVERQSNNQKLSIRQSIRNRKSQVDDSGNTFEHKYWALTTLFGELEGTLEVREHEIERLKDELQKEKEKLQHLQKAVIKADTMEQELEQKISETVYEMYALESNHSADIDNNNGEEEDKEKRELELKLRKRELEHDLACIKKINMGKRRKLDN